MGRGRKNWATRRNEEEKMRKNREDGTGARRNEYGAQKQPFDSALKNML